MNWVIVSYIFCLAILHVLATNDTLKPFEFRSRLSLCDDQHLNSSEPCVDKSLAVISRVGNCPQNTVPVGQCTGENVFCSGFGQDNSQVPGICVQGSCCALQNPQTCFQNQGLATPLSCTSNCPATTPCDQQIGFCCMHRTRINGLCPQNQVNAGLCSQPNAICQVPGASNTGTCSQNYVCCLVASNNNPSGQCPFGSVSSGVACNSWTSQCTANGQQGTCQNGICCVYNNNSPTNQCPSGSVSSGVQCNSWGSQCIGNGRQGVCQNGICCVYDNNVPTNQCPSGSVPSGVQCNSWGSQCFANGGQGICQNGICCVYNNNNPTNQCPAGSYSSGVQCNAGSSQCFANGGQGICQNGICCVYNNNNPTNQCPAGSVSSGVSCNSWNPQCNANGRVGTCQNGVCCVSDNNVPSNQCPADTVSSGVQCNSWSSQCTANGRQGVCQNGVCCLYTNNPTNQCPPGSVSSGVSCNSWTSICFANTQQGICQNGICCVQGNNPQTCQAGGQPIGTATCYSDNQCRQIAHFAYCDLSINRCCSISVGQCQNNEYNIGTCTGFGSCGSGINSGVCRSGVCCSYRCQNGASFNGQVCTIAQNCQVTSSVQIPTCEQGHCCLSSTPTPGQCPFGMTPDYTRTCSIDNECYSAGSYGRCISNHCCLNNQNDVCAKYGMVKTGQTCFGNSPVCNSATQTNVYCKEGYCCASSNFPTNGLGLCYNGETAQKTCRRKSDCSANQSCMNGLCCTLTGNEWKYACGGITAVSSCTQQGFCAQQMSCTTSNYCCECPYGQTSGSCTHGCPPGYACGANNYCCPTCSNGQEPLGSCFEGKCGNQHRCNPGNICCPTF